MFKGLRTKIESEHKGKLVDKVAKQPGQPASLVSQNDNHIYSSSSSSSLVASAANELPSLNNHQEAAGSSGRSTPHNVPIISTQTNKTTEQQIASTQSAEPSINSKPKTSFPAANLSTLAQGDEPQDEVARLRAEVNTLTSRLKAVIEERDENVEQNAQLYQLIEKLRKSLDIEQEQSTNLRVKLKEAESALKDRMGLMFNSNFGKGSQNSSKASDLLGPDGKIRDDQNPTEVIRILQHEIIELQNQLAKKNRQLKIKQQNLTDMKKSLQKEIMEHSRSQDELRKYENLVKQQQQQLIYNDGIHDGAQQNGLTSSTINTSLTSDIDTHTTTTTATARLNFNHKTGDNKFETSSASSRDQQQDQAGDGENLATTHSVKSFNISGNHQQALDSISCISKSSASLDDCCDSNELQQNQVGAGSTNYNKDVNHEYLRNVLFRYMTSTDSETSQHLVKALSVMMNFSPEQSSAIKSAMNTKSSWLRLK